MIITYIPLLRDVVKISCNSSESISLSCPAKRENISRNLASREPVCNKIWRLVNNLSFKNIQGLLLQYLLSSS